MVQDWRDEAKCRHHEQQSIFFPDPDTAGEPGYGQEAKQVCVSCPSNLYCLDYAVRANEEGGIWGGTDRATREWLHTQLELGAQQYKAGLQKVLEELELWISEARRTWNQDLVCELCGDRIRPGARPKNRNTPGATCGKTSTYNRGCRCDPCVWAKAVTDAKAKQRQGP